MRFTALRVSVLCMEAPSQAHSDLEYSWVWGDPRFRGAGRGAC